MSPKEKKNTISSPNELRNSLLLKSPGRLTTLSNSNSDSGSGDGKSRPVSKNMGGSVIVPSPSGNRSQDKKL